MRVSAPAMAVALGTLSIFPRALAEGNGTLKTFSWDTTKTMFVFGDSFTTIGWKASYGALSPDTNLTRSNGPNWVDYLTKTFNETSIYKRNFASSGATIANELVCHPGHEAPLKTQVETFVKVFTPPPSGLRWEAESTLFASFIGINDVGLAFERENQKAFHEREFVAWSQLQESLYASGARHFLHVNVPPVDRTPRYINLPNLELKASIADFNIQLRASCLKFQQAHADAVVMLYDARTAFTHLLDDAPSLGFKNVTQFCPAYSHGTPAPNTLSPECVNPVNDFFWIDSYHPNSPAHHLFAQGVRSFLDAPTTVTETPVLPTYMGVLLQEHARRKIRVPFG